MKKPAIREKLTVIGRTSRASFPAENISGVPVKVDTGADSSSIWASNLHIDDNYILHFVLFAQDSPYYSGKKHATSVYTVRLVRSSNGQAQIRYSVKLTVVIAGRKVRGTFTLADRSSNQYPILIGCKLLYRKFLVDVSKGNVRTDLMKPMTNQLNKELSLNPRAFFEKYHIENERGDVKT